nr:exportin-2-like [Lytechinus pictus]
MASGEEDLKNLASCLQQTLSTIIKERKEAEQFLESVEGSPNYAIMLLLLIELDTVDDTIRQSSAITFKNFVKRNWRVVEDEPNKISDEDRLKIKKKIVGLMLSVPLKLQRQLSDAISMIGKEDFPDKWDSLLGELTSQFQSGNFHVINGVLRTAHSLFKRYRYEFKSNALWKEIKFVLDNFAQPLTQLFYVSYFPVGCWCRCSEHSSGCLWSEDLPRHTVDNSTPKEGVDVGAGVSIQSVNQAAFLIKLLTNRVNKSTPK